jgi:hypothetical protein
MGWAENSSGKKEMMSTETSTAPAPSLRISKPPSIQAHRFPLLLAAVLMTALSARAAALESRVLEIHYRSAEEMLSVASPLLSPAGRISSDARTNSLIVVDTPASIQRIVEVVQRLDLAPVTLRIDVRFGQSRSADKQGARVEGRLSGNGWQVSTDRPDQDGVHVRIYDQTRTESRSSKFSVTTLSGSPAYMTVGTEVPYRQRKNGICRRYGGCPPAVEFHRVETGFWIIPLLAGDRIDLEIVPQIADLASGKRVRFSAASARVRVRPGQWTEIGGGDKAETDALAEILGVAGTRENDAFSISLKVERLDK